MSKFLSLTWFKSKIEQAVEKVITNKIETLMEQEDGVDEVVQPLAKPPYLNIKLVNDVLTILLLDGNIICKLQATKEDFLRAKNAITEDELFNLVISREVMEEKKKDTLKANKIKAMQEGLSILENSEQFDVVENTVYFKGINRSVPTLLVEELLRVVNASNDTHIPLENNVEFLSLKRFFMWCCLNPRAEVADDLYKFLKDNSFRITKQGFFVALRNVVTVHNDSTGIVEFISNAYNKVKAVWKKSPDNYRVVKTPGDEYKFELVTSELSGNTIIGNLTTLYLDLPNMSENRYTDAHTKTFDIRVGKVVNMPMEDCNWSRADCAHAGLHFTSDEIHYVGCGDTSVLILINPMKVVGIGNSKGRCYEYLPIMTVPREEATLILHDLEFDTLELDEDFAIRELDNLEELAKQGFSAESTKYDFNFPQISSSQIKAIVASLSEMKHELENRIVNID